jgi:hypothetical protein
MSENVPSVPGFLSENVPSVPGFPVFMETPLFLGRRFLAAERQASPVGHFQLAIWKADIKKPLWPEPVDGRSLFLEDFQISTILGGLAEF